MKIKDLLLSGNIKLKESNIKDSNLKVKILLSDLLNKTKEYLIINSELELDDEIEKEFFVRIERLKNNEPIQYIIKKQDFYGLEFYVDENVLIPQPDTEILVEECINIINNSKGYEKNIYNFDKKEIKILDLCTGSGAIGVSLAKNIKATVIVSDISEKALEIARKNAIKNDVKIESIKSNMFENINQKFDMIVSNPPYIESSIIKKLSEEVRKEPIIALDGGIDGLDFYKEIAKETKNYLNSNGILALEIGYDQRQAVEEILKQNGFKNIYSKKDLGGNDRIVVATV